MATEGRVSVAMYGYEAWTRESDHMAHKRREWKEGGRPRKGMKKRLKRQSGGEILGELELKKRRATIKKKE